MFYINSDNMKKLPLKFKIIKTIPNCPFIKNIEERGCRENCYACNQPHQFIDIYSNTIKISRDYVPANLSLEEKWKKIQLNWGIDPKHFKQLFIY